MYALVHDGQVISTEMPRIGRLPDGRKVSNFDKLDPKVLRNLGWYPIEDPGPPEYDPRVEEVARSLSVQGDRVVAVYSLQAVAPTTEPEVPGLTTQEQLDTLLDLLVDKGTITTDDVKVTKNPRKPDPTEGPVPGEDPRRPQMGRRE